ncbi:MAG: hypothetical protein HY669_01815 [Chloroflexi bacterium]|nr:hypothetical protein [Chloroflexota bacterium]
MTVRNVAAVSLAIVVIISLVSIWFYPSIQDFMLANPFWNGLRSFSREFNATWINSLPGVSRNPQATTLIAIPYAPYSQGDAREVERFVRDGGLLVLLDDYGYGNSLLSELGLPARFSGRPLLDPLFSYRNEWLPRITDFYPELAEADIKAIVLNHGTALVSVDSAQVLARSSPSSFLDVNGNGVKDKEEPQGPFPVAAVSRLGNGTVLLVSDPSILVNSMVGRDDNRAFLNHLINRYGQGSNVLVDISHLPKAPLDESKLRLIQTRQRIAHPYSIAAMLGVVILLVLRPLSRREPVEHK